MPPAAKADFFFFLFPGPLTLGPSGKGNVEGMLFLYLLKKGLR